LLGGVKKEGVSKPKAKVTVEIKRIAIFKL
jgi:hypothetical protein